MYKDDKSNLLKKKKIVSLKGQNNEFLSNHRKEIKWKKILKWNEDETKKKVVKKK